MTLLVSPSFLIPSLLCRCQISPNALYIYLTHTELTGHALKILQNAAALFKLLSTLSQEAITYLHMTNLYLGCQLSEKKVKISGYHYLYHNLPAFPIWLFIYLDPFIFSYISAKRLPGFQIVPLM